VGDDSHFVFHQKLQGEDGSVRWGIVMVKQPGLFSLKFGAKSSHVFTQSPQNIAVEPGIHSLAHWDKFFVHNPLNIKESDDHALDIAFHFCGLGDMGLFHWEDCCFVSVIAINPALITTDDPRQEGFITLVNTQNVSVTKIVDSSSIQCPESKYGLRVQFLTLVVIIHEVWLNA